MVSLLAVENIALEIDPDHISAAIAVQNEKKGEAIILFTSSKNIDKKSISSFITKKGSSKLLLPQSVIYIEEVPLLGSGKTDYNKLKKDYL